MVDIYRWLHEKLEQLPLTRYPFRLESLPRNGIYFLYEEGETWGQRGKQRIVRVGTHTGNNRFRSRIAEHYLLKEEKMDFNKNRPKPSDRSIFRKNIGRALLNKNNDPYLRVWNISFIERKNREQYGHLRDIQKEKNIERQITQIIRSTFTFRYIKVDDREERLELEERLISTLAKTSPKHISKNWLGLHSPIRQIRQSGLWNVKHVNSPRQIEPKHLARLEQLIQETLKTEKSA